MASDPAQSDEPINQYAVVTYIPDRLGEFLNRLRQELVPGSTGLAHVTVLPPRRLQVSNGEAADWIGGHLQGAHAFPIGVAEVQVFELTDVIYAEIGTGREALLDLHYKLAAEALSFSEQYPYHPHVTLAQNIDRTVVPEMFAYAQSRWHEYRHERAFLLDRITFVQNTEQNHWLDLACYQLPNSQK